MRIYFATWLAEKSQGEALTKVNAPRRLLSYFFIREQKVSQTGMKKYSRTGTLDLKDKLNKIENGS